MPWVDNLPSTLYLKSARLSPTTMPQGTQGAARYRIIYRRNLVFPSCGACYKLASPILSSIFCPPLKFFWRTGEMCGRAAFAPRLCRAIPRLAKWRLTKVPVVVNKFFRGQATFFDYAGQIPIYDTCPVIVTTCQAHSKQRANFQE